MTSAAQVAELAGVDAEALPPADQGVRARYEELRDQGDMVAAIDYIGHALPRMEAIWWAARLIDGEARRHPPPPRDRQALDHALRWLGEPDDDNRRASYEAAEAAGERSAERMLAMAAFFSGGSIAPPDLPPVLPAPETACRFVVGAVLAAAYRTDAPEAVLTRALALAEWVAEMGTTARIDG